MSHDLQLDLDVVLPDAHGDDDHCVRDLVGALSTTGGVRDVHVVPATATAPAQVCLHVEPGQVSLRRLAEVTRSTGSAISTRYGHAVWRLAGISHAARADLAAARLRRLPGVLDARVVHGGNARIEFDREVTGAVELRRAVVAAGFSIVGVDEDDAAPRATSGDAVSDAVAERGAIRRGHATVDDDDHDHGHDAGHHHAHGGRSELVVALVAGAVYAVARVLDWTIADDAVSQTLYMVAAAVTAVSVGRDVAASLRARRFTIEVLMWVAAAGAAVLGHWSDAALLLVLFSLGHALEGYAMGRARRAIEALAELAPTTAHRRRPDGAVEEVPVDAVVVGDVLVVRPDGRVPADGVVVAGTTCVDESPVTGESVPVDKRPVLSTDVVPFDQVAGEHRVFSGTLNGPGAIDVLVARPARDSTLARVVQMVADAETQISPTQVLTDRIVAVFVPSVLVLVAGFLRSLRNSARHFVQHPHDRPACE